MEQVDTTNQKVYFTNYNSYDGTLEGEYMEGAVFEATDGILYFGGVDGFNVLRPGNIAASPLPFKPVFISLRLRGEEVKPGSIYDTSFLTRAMEMVEKNLNVPGYSVEQLSRDLCMDRTGLYRKLTAMLDQSPSIFIRNIRLQRAAQLILQGELSIAEITERVGFSSSSYLSKCFQEEFSCRPSEYVAKMKKNAKE